MPTKYFSLSRAIAAILEHKTPTGTELEMHLQEQGRRETSGVRAALGVMSAAARAGGFCLHLPLTERTVSVTDPITGGGNLVGQTTTVVSDLLSWSACVAAGCQVLTDLRDNLNLARVSKLPPVQWVPELGFSVGDPEFQSIALHPKRVTGTIIVSNQLLIQGAGDPSLDQMLINDLSRSCSSQLDRLALMGDPDTFPDQPRGILHTPGCHALDVGVDTAYDWLVEGERLVENENISIGTYAHITSPDVRAELRKQMVVPTTAVTVWDSITRPFSSVQVTDDRIYFGAFGMMTIATWAVDIMVNRYRLSSTSQTEILASLYGSVGIRLPKAFGFTKDPVGTNPLSGRKGSSGAELNLKNPESSETRTAQRKGAPR